MNQPKVSIIITAYSPTSKPYLDLLMQSVALLAYENKEVIIVSPKNYAPIYDGAKTISPPDGPDRGNDYAINVGIEATPDSDYHFILNDDVMLTRDCLKHLVETSKACDDVCVLTGLSNDTMNRYFLHCPIQPGQYRLHDIQGIEKDLMMCSSPYPNGLIFYDTLCLYAFLLPKKIREAVGVMDTQYETGPSDISYTLRVIKAGYRNAIVLNSLIYHAGAVTSAFTITDEMRIRNAALFEQQWGKGVLYGDTTIR